MRKAFIKLVILLFSTLFIFFFSFGKDEINPVKNVKDLKIIVGLFVEEDVDFFNQYLKTDDIVFTFRSKINLLKKIKGPKTAFGCQSIKDIKKSLKELGDTPVDYINYNPEKWRSSHTPREEINDPIDGVNKVRTLTNEKKAKLSFGTDHVLLDKYGEKIAPLVDLFGIQLQQLQTEPLDDFRRDAQKKIEIVRKGSKNVPIFLQISLSPPKKKIAINPLGKKVKTFERGIDGKKVLLPLKAEEVLEQINTIKDLADGIVIYYHKDDREEMKNLIRLMRQ